MIKKLRIHSDGGARGNPGPAGIGAVLEGWDQANHQWKIVKKIKRFLGEATNNQAEYQALIAALEAAKELKAVEVECFLDSELLVRQLNHQYRVKDQELALLFLAVWNLATAFRRISYHHLRREKNQEADRLVNEAIDEAQKK